eukprot:GHVR01065461.1.p1 GENE.GHVR01065461.1~~GHVR01065461.1.p1  ORF type:complete len:103 (-),score=7.12 GHVR01065461.1:289-567(-)
MTALMHGIPHPEAVEILLEAGSTPNSMDNNGNFCIRVSSSPADFRTMPEFFETGKQVEALTRQCIDTSYVYGAKHNCRDYMGRIPHIRKMMF